MLLLIVPPVYAKETELPSPGILPSSPWYRVELFFEQVGEFIIFDKEAKAERLLMHADERLAEIKALVEQEQGEEVEAVLAAYRNKLQKAEQLVETEQQNGNNVDETLIKVSEVTLRHQAVLTEVYEKVPDRAKPAIEQTIERSLQGHERATESVSQEKKKEVYKQVEETRQRVEERLNILGEEGKPTPSVTIPRGRSEVVPTEEYRNPENRGQEQNNALLDLPQQVKDVKAVPEQDRAQVKERVQEKINTNLPPAR